MATLSKISLSEMALHRSYLFWIESKTVHKIAASVGNGTSSTFFTSSSDLNGIAVYTSTRMGGKLPSA